MQFCNPSIVHGTNKLSPGGRLGAFTITPSGQTILYCFFIIQGISPEACLYCGCIKPHSFKNCLCLAGSLSAHMCSEEYEAVLPFCKGNKDSHLQSLEVMGTWPHLPYTDCDNAASCVCPSGAFSGCVCGGSAQEQNEGEGYTDCSAVHEHCPTHMNYTQGVHIDTKLVLFRTCVVQIQFDGEIGGKSEVSFHHGISHNTVLDTNNLPFSADMPHRFSAGSCAAICWRPCGNARIASAAMRGSSARQYADRPWICAIVRG